MNQNINLCTICKEYYEFKENHCSNCYNFKINGKYNIDPNSDINFINNKLIKYYINSKNLSLFTKIVINNLNMSYDELFELIKDLDIYITSNNAQIIYNLLEKDKGREMKLKLIHLLSHKIVDYWNNKLGGPSCYYNNFNEKPKDFNNAMLFVKKNQDYFKSFGYGGIYAKKSHLPQ